LAEKILVVDDEEIIRESLAYVLRKEGYEVAEASNGQQAYDIIVESSFDLVITDIEMPQMKGIDLLKKIKEVDPKTDVIIITAFGSMDTAINALRNGAGDYILKPLEFDELLIKIKRFFQLRKLETENKILKRDLNIRFDYENIIGDSKAIRKVFNIIETVADSDSTVLITGRSGTGKELVARALHQRSHRKNHSFIAINCGAIPENLIESELFGHKKGTFTGAISDREGFIKAADKGTLFLDEISEMPLNLQVKLLRVIQEKEYTPVGRTLPIPVDVRFVASTNRNLKEEILEGRFREDLFYRLNVIEINLPTLKERKEDIPMLANYFLDKYRKDMKRNIKGFDKDAMRAFIANEWRGEVRELENTIERAVIFCRTEYITLDDLTDQFKKAAPPEITEQAFTGELSSLDDSVSIFEKEYILHVLKETNNNKERAADILKVGLSTLYRKMKELGIDSK
jgi:DNA-binding NtrC family response regulator